MTSIDVSPTEKTNSRSAPPQKKARMNSGTDDNYDVFSDPFTETQIETPGYYDKQFTQPSAQFFDPSFHQVLGGFMPYTHYEPIVPPPNQFPPQYTIPQSVAPPPQPPAPPSDQNVAPSDPPKRKRFGVGGGRKRVEPTETKHRKLQRFSSVIFCDKCDDRTSFDGTTLKVDVCPDCVVKSGTSPM